jgi:hypothetical protein
MNTQTTETESQTVTQLRAIFKAMDPYRANEIRESFQEAMSGLEWLARLLEAADADQSPSGGVLLNEHFLAVQALEAMKKSRLGAVL